MICHEHFSRSLISPINQFVRFFFFLRLNLFSVLNHLRRDCSGLVQIHAFSDPLESAMRNASMIEMSLT